MAAGEYVSVSSLRDTELSLLNKEQAELTRYPKQELEDLRQIYEHKGLNKKDALLIAKKLMKHDPNTAHVFDELGINLKNLANPWKAALASSFAYLAGATIPFIAVVIPSSTYRVPFVFAAVIMSLAVTGVISAKIGNASIPRAVIRIVFGGVFAMTVAFLVGRLFGISIS
jgi:VIT1/CCC1 family predicted Fe2+/Mn2+ transporter